MNFVIGSTPIHLQKGQMLYFNNSYKFPEHGFQAMCRAAGFESAKQPTYDASNKIAFHTLRAV